MLVSRQECILLTKGRKWVNPLCPNDRFGCHLDPRHFKGFSTEQAVTIHALEGSGQILGRNSKIWLQVELKGVQP